MKGYAQFLENVEMFRMYPRRRTGFLRIYLEYLFSDVSFEGKSVLDIGAGNGLHSLFSIYQGAKRVVGLEPELEGGQRGTFEVLDLISQRFPKFTPKKETFQAYNGIEEEFDVIIIHNAINHLDEVACQQLHLVNERARELYRTLFVKLDRLSQPGAVTKIADCARSNFYPEHRLRNPFAPTIDWTKHQSPSIWCSFLSQLGWTQTSIRWLTPLTLVDPDSISDRIGESLSHLFSSHFCLTMMKTRTEPTDKRQLHQRQ